MCAHICMYFRFSYMHIDTYILQLMNSPIEIGRENNDGDPWSYTLTTLNSKMSLTICIPIVPTLQDPNHASFPMAQAKIPTRRRLSLSLPQAAGELAEVSECSISNRQWFVIPYSF